MIIKSMARKEPTFAQLYDYITREGDYDEDYCFTRNFILRDREAILNEFERNSKLLSKRKNGNYLYHEIISITRAKGISEQAQKDKLIQIVQQYAESRSKDCLVFGGLHVEKGNNLHFHLIISANELNQTRRYRLSKHQFSEVKIGLETHVLEHHPELEQEKLISAGRTQEGKTTNREDALKRRTGKPSQKELFKEKLQSIFEKSVDKNNFFTNLETADIECYTRGQTVGFLDRSNGKKHRLKTLGLVAEFEAIHNKIVNNTKWSETADQPKPEAKRQNQADPRKQQRTEQQTEQKAQVKKSALDTEAEKRRVDIRKQRADETQQADEQAQKNTDDSSDSKQNKP